MYILSFLLQIDVKCTNIAKDKMPAESFIDLCCVDFLRKNYMSLWMSKVDLLVEIIICQKVDIN